MSVYVYSASGDHQEIRVFSSLEKAIDYAKSLHYPDAEFEQHKYDENCWFFDDPEDPVEILKLEIE